jgi:glycosyltransferase involved in cell wall biosynthesis
MTIYDLIPIRSPELFRPFIVSDMKRQLRECCRDDSWVIAISQATKDDFCNYTNTPPSRVFVTHLAAADHFFPERNPDIISAVRRKYRVPDGRFLLSVCTLEPRKNLESVIKAFAELILAERIEDLNLVLVGNVGWNPETIFTEFERYPALRERVIFTGYVPDEELRALYSDATAFVYLSVYEGFGLPPLEAMQCGTPVITSNVSSLPEVVGEAGIKLPPHDLPAISQAMLSLYRDPNLRRTMAAASLARSTEFSWDKCAADTVRAYARILA